MDGARLSDILFSITHIHTYSIVIECMYTRHNNIHLVMINWHSPNLSIQEKRFRSTLSTAPTSSLYMFLLSRIRLGSWPLVSCIIDTQPFLSILMSSSDFPFWYTMFYVAVEDFFYPFETFFVSNPQNAPMTHTHSSMGYCKANEWIQGDILWPVVKLLNSIILVCGTNRS